MHAGWLAACDGVRVLPLRGGIAVAGGHVRRSETRDGVELYRQDVVIFA